MLISSQDPVRTRREGCQKYRVGCGSEETFFVQWSSVVEQLTHKHAVSMFFFCCCCCCWEGEFYSFIVVRKIGSKLIIINRLMKIYVYGL